MEICCETTYFLVLAVYPPLKGDSAVSPRGRGSRGGHLMCNHLMRFQGSLKA